jgi:hypothetical protein
MRQVLFEDMPQRVLSKEDKIAMLNLSESVAAAKRAQHEEGGGKGRGEKACLVKIFKHTFSQACTFPLPIPFSADFLPLHDRYS